MTALLVAAFFMATAARGGTTFEFEGEKKGTASYSFRGRALLDGDNIRYEITEGAHPVFNPGITIVSIDGGQLLLIVDHRQKTYFYRRTDSMASPVGTFQAPGNQSAGKPEITVEARGQQPFEGKSGKSLRIDVRYPIHSLLEGERLHAKVAATAEITFLPINGDAVPYGLHFLFKTGFPAIDRRIAGARAKRGLPVAESLSVTRTIDDGPPVTESMTVRISNVKEAPVDAGLFRPPEGYRFEEPTFGY